MLWPRINHKIIRRNCGVWGVRTLFIISFLSLGLSFLTNLIYNLIIMPIKKDMERNSEGPHYINDNDLKSYYHMNKPMILRQVSFLNLLIEKGGFLFFFLFSVLFLVVVYSAKHSILWTLLYIPGLIFLYFVLNLISVFLSRVLVRWKKRFCHKAAGEGPGKIVPFLKDVSYR